MSALMQMLLAGGPTSAFLSGGTPDMYGTGTTESNINDNNPATEGTSGTLINFTGLGIASRILASIDYGSTKTITRIYGRCHINTSDLLPKARLAYWDGAAWQMTGATFLNSTTYDALDLTGLNVSGSKIAIVTSGNGGSEDNYNGYTLTCSDLLAEGY